MTIGSLYFSTGSHVVQKGLPAKLGASSTMNIASVSYSQCLQCWNFKVHGSCVLKACAGKTLETIG